MKRRASLRCARRCSKSGCQVCSIARRAICRHSRIADALTIGSSAEATRLAASRFIALVQGQLVFSAACGGTISARTRTAHVNDAVEAFLKMYGESG